MKKSQLRSIIKEEISKILKENKLWADFRSGSTHNSDESRFARTMSELLSAFRPSSNITLDELFDDGEMRDVQDGDPFYAGPTESLRIFRSLPEHFIVSNNIQGSYIESYKITKTGPNSFSAEEL